MKAEGIDPRYESSLEEDPDYRVDFWGETVLDDGSIIDGADEWLLTGAEDVHEALSWAKENAKGRDFVLYAKVQDGESIGLTQLAGREPGSE